MSLAQSLELTITPHRDHVRVAPSGELDLSTAGMLRAQLEELWDLGWTDVVVDLRELSFIDSSGLHVLIDMHQHAAEVRRRFSIVDDGAQPVARVLEISGLGRLFTSVPATPPRR
jgi:anti-anti-sigma factor